MNSPTKSARLALREEIAFIPSSSKVSLETKIFHGSKNRDTCILLAHPYGPLGGNMDNNVIRALFENFATQGYMTVRFNFRGVGKSSGRTTARGMGEIEDVLSIYKYVRDQVNLAPRRFVVCGYSYGSVAASAAASEIKELAGIISISYPSSVLWALTFFNSKKFTDAFASTSVPKLFLMGNKDNFTGISSHTSFIDGFPEPKESIVMSDVDHFWFGYEDSICGHVNTWMKRSGLTKLPSALSTPSTATIPGTPTKYGSARSPEFPTPTKLKGSLMALAVSIKDDDGDDSPQPLGKSPLSRSEPALSNK
ncbi:Alpha/Beta hydrolase protein [Polychytrium aggregatum]|uniref:Alpha/Beta hydrolase protein n=1 Tax=Polychytrium aggregatum TaxID=110093 RepID=UPI0022FE39B1|nr:Alpha/Beta hydrolase protein [Polychytrium aggregatum]KAI9208842.1 Alpha/Beta hydrolase protein [Polychytrium aggregatum]